MSYAEMDHAGWVEANGAAARLRAKPARDRYGTPMGWCAMPERLAPFQRRVMDVIGLSMGGIYNAPVAWDAVRWGHPSDHGWHIHVPLRHASGFSTYDFNRLTLLVLACHQARIRLDVGPHGPRGLMLSFHKRDAGGGQSGRHPDIDEAVAAFRRYVPADHPITHRAEEEAVAT